MALELETYFIDCPHCAKEVEFIVNNVDGLACDIDDEINKACADERRDVEREFEGMVDPADHPIQPRTMHDLAAAIRRGDVFEAELLLARVAEDLGAEHFEAAQIGRFSHEARRAT